MRIKRVLQGTALAALAAAAWIGAGSDASASAEEVAADPTLGGISAYYYGGHSIGFSTNDTEFKEIIVGIAKADKSGASAKVSSWDIYDIDNDNEYGIYEAWVNLQKVNIAKDAFIAVKTDKMETPVFFKIDANAAKTKAELNAGTREVTFKVNNTAVDVNKDGSKVVDEYGQYYGRYNDDDYNNNNIPITKDGKILIDSEYQYQGAVMYFGLAGIKYNTDKELAKAKITDKTDSKTGKETEIITVGKFPSKQAKLNVPKQANGPAIPVDYVKGTIKIKKGVELRVVGENGISKAVSGSAASAFENKTVLVGDFYDAIKAKDFASMLGEEKGALEVRVAAKTDGKGKAASKWTRVAIEKPKAIEVKAVKEDASEVTTSSAVAYTVSGASVELKYTSNKKTGAADKGLILDNKSDYKIDYVIGNTTAPKADDKGKVDSMKTVAKKAVTIKNLSDNQVIWVRIAGNKNEKQWASDWKELITVKIPQAK